MFFGDKKKILFLKRNSLDLLDESGKIQASCVFPDSVIHNLEIENPQQFELLVNKLIPVKKTKIEVILVLSDELIFYKSYPKNISQNPALTQYFLNSIPFESESILHIKYLTKDWLTLLAVNKSSIESLESILQRSGWVVKAVIPGFLFGKVNSNGTLSPEIIQQIGQREKQTKEYNFLTST